jgi:hypothetical protein
VSATPESPEPATATPPEDSAGPAVSGPLPADRPEMTVGAAFAGGFVLAMILKRLAR